MKKKPIPNNNLLTDNTVFLSELAELIPGWLHLNDLEGFALIYMSPKMEKDIKTSIKEIRENGVEFLQSIIHPETTRRVIPQLQALVEKKDYKKIISFYQLIRLPGQDYEWYLTNTKLYKELNCTISITNPLRLLTDFQEKIEKVLNDNLFLKTNLSRYDQLTRREKEIINELIRGKTQKEIAKKLHLSQFTVKTHRQNIYRKLNISSVVELIQFADRFGLL